jgi:hypothetical protein
MYAAQIWHRRCQANPLSKATGSIIQNMLVYGASKPSKEILYEAARGEVDPKYYLDNLT